MIDPSPILALAPMAGITDWPMRLLCAEQGCNYTTTEMVSAMGYLTAPDSLYVYQYLLAVHPDEPRPAVQLFGHHPDLMGQAAQRLSELGRFSAIDINMGCPARKVTGSGSGSALMRDLPLCAQIITAVRKSTVLPVTVKMRLGWDDDHLCAPELAHIAQECGADLLTVHGRTREQQYAGQADWQAVARVKQAVRIPVLSTAISYGDSARVPCERQAPTGGHRPWSAGQSLFVCADPRGAGRAASRLSYL